ncbi:serine hydrolase [Corallococcus llansteffanensis]|uniref:beta-lactamase n=1 Tax=Corallococcus llansteffanensis TaxID=2316731 RepID=A0A3A8PYN5_9BACT|nr:serine hydrolase [Corallococcus llansteffanensis]RKH60998.1 serine hydrolase [Corallococcus llansteffanensis]
MRGGIGSSGGWLSLLVTLLGAPAGAAPAVPEPPPWRAVLNEGVEAAARDFDGALTLYVRDVRTGEEYAFNASTPMYLSSAIKVAVMLEVLRQVDTRTLALDRPVVFGPDDVRDGMHPLAKVPSGTSLTVAALLDAMMVHSDNAAADLLIGQVGIDNVNAGLERRGVRFGPLVSLLEDRRHVYAKLDPKGAALGPTQVRELGRSNSLASRAEALSRVLGHMPAWTGDALESAFDAYYVEGTNSAPMREVGRLLEQVARCVGLSPAACEHAKALLRRCDTGRARIRAGLPDTAVWAHKTGTQHRRACDVGLLEWEHGPSLVVAACARDFRRVSDAERLLARLGRTLARAFQRTPGRTDSFSARNARDAAGASGRRTP